MVVCKRHLCCNAEALRVERKGQANEPGACSQLEDPQLAAALERFFERAEQASGEQRC